MLSKDISSLLENLKRHHSLPQEKTPETLNDSSAIGTNAITRRAGTWYEKIRNLLDYQEDHAVKISVVRRILRRKLVFSETNGMGNALLGELARGGYLSGKENSVTTANKIDRVIEKWNAVGNGNSAGAEKNSWGKFLGFATAEVYRIVFPSLSGDLSADTFAEYIAPRISFAPPIKSEDTSAEILTASRRSLLGTTDTELSYMLWLKHFPEWKNDNLEITNSVRDKARKVVTQIERQIKNPLGWIIARRIKNEAIYFSLIKEIIDKYGLDAENIFGNEKLLEETVREMAEEKYLASNKRARESGGRAVFYVFATKMFFALLIELPYDLFIIRSVDAVALGANILFHPFFLFLTTKNLKCGGKKNTEAIIAGVKKVTALETKNEPIIRVKTAREKNAFEIVLLCLYALLFLLSFGVIIAVLNVFNFNPASIAVFIFFLALVTYFSFRIRHHAMKWKVETEDEGIFTLLWDLFTLPIARFGRRLSITFSSINVFIFIMDILIEAPFKMLLGVFDAFVSFLREKKEEIR